ncbi:MAG: P-loop NTPase [Firmicutes bacterium]|nr:P-loop NTPase [Bacillota bacterium]
MTKNEIVVVASGKGGVGKTTIASCLALALQRRHVSVSLIDFDFRCPCVESMLQLTPSRGLKGFISSTGNLGGPAIESLMATHESGLKVLVPDGGIKLNHRDVERILRNMIRISEVVVIDAGIDTDEHVRACVSFATKVLLVTTLTAPSVQMCKEWLAKISSREFTKVQLLINKSDRTAAFPITAAHRVLGVGSGPILPNEPGVVKGESCGYPLPARGAFAKQINNLADIVWPWKAAGSWKSSGNSKRSGILSSLRGLLKR